MPRRDRSEERSSNRRKPAGRSGARSTSSRSGRSDSESRGSSRSSRGDSKSFSKTPRGGKSYSRSKDGSSFDKPARSGNFRSRSEGKGFSSHSEKSFTRSRDDRDDSKRSSGFSDKSQRGKKTFNRSKDDSFEKPRTRDDEKRSSAFSDSRESKRTKFSDKEDRGDKKGFFSKLSRGGKAFTRSAAPAPEYGKDISKSKEDLASDKIRLNRYISNSGICSRREADELIKMGLVTVNGTVVTEMGHKVSRKDVVKYDGKTLRAEKPVYILMNKPKGFLTTTKDPQDRNTVMQIIAESVKERVYPVGRLDRNTTGLLLLTNDGELADKLMHPSHNVKKIYKVDLDKPITKADFEKVKKGVHLEEGKAIVDDLAIVSDDGKTIGIEVHIGWNRVIRRIFESLGYEVVKLDRSVYAGLDKKDLSRGHWRHLTREEVVRLKHYQ